MTAIAESDHRESASRAIRTRILNVLPAATYQMDRFFQFADIVVSDRSATACVEVGPQPRLHLNARFIQKSCRHDEHLLMLVLHELYHVILGHTRLFPRLTEAHNIAFDAVINSMLCRQFSDPIYLGFFTRLNPANRFPGRLLRPPKGWPDRPIVAANASQKESALMALLYGKHAATVTYQEILALLQGELPRTGESTQPNDGESGPDGPGDPKGDYVLLGDHGGVRGSGQLDEAAVADPLVTDVLRRVTEKWPAGASLETGRGEGDTALCYLLPKPRSPRAEFLHALKRLLDKAGVLRPPSGSPYAWKREIYGLETTTVIPDWRDRQAHSRAALTNSVPLIYRSETVVSRPRWQPRHIAHIYLDVSGSMVDHLPWLAGALEPLQQRGLCRLYVFSTVVDEVRRRGLLTDRIQNTFGTDIACVYNHFLGLPQFQTPQCVVVLTDGLTGSPSAKQAAEAMKRKVRLIVGLVGAGSSDDLRAHAFVMAALPALS